MVDGADRRKADLANCNESDGLLFKIHDDARMTRLGRLLRRTSIDELPQRWNVLPGTCRGRAAPALPAGRPDASVGRDRRRLEVRPGLTGLWQVSGRSELSWASGSNRPSLRGHVVARTRSGHPDRAHGGRPGPGGLLTWVITRRDPDGAAPTAGAGTLSLRGRAPAPDRRPDTSTRQGRRRRRRRSERGRRREDLVVLAIVTAGGVAGALLTDASPSGHAVADHVLVGAAVAIVAGAASASRRWTWLVLAAVALATAGDMWGSWPRRSRSVSPC